MGLRPEQRRLPLPLQSLGVHPTLFLYQLKELNTTAPQLGPGAQREDRDWKGDGGFQRLRSFTLEGGEASGGLG